MTVTPYHSNDYTELINLWEDSVRSSHHFLTENDISTIRKALPTDYFPNVTLYVIRHHNEVAAFMGLSADMVEMLFVSTKHQGHGYGSALIDFALNRGITKVDVNEQNEAARKFYFKKGFQIISRSEYDTMGNHFPILHLQKN